MSGVQEIDPVLKSVRQAVSRLGIDSEGPLGQQILLLGETFYGYRFTSKEFTAVWSVTDQTLNIFDAHGKRLGSSLMSVGREERTIDGQSSIRLPESYPGRKAA